MKILSYFYYKKNDILLNDYYCKNFIYNKKIKKLRNYGIVNDTTRYSICAKYNYNNISF